MTTPPILIMAGGTGGHIFPALAVANELKSRKQSVVWLGSPLGLEAKIVPEAGIEIEWLQVKGLRRKGPVAWLFAPWRLLNALYCALRILKRRQPGVVLGMGGFVTGPGGLGAWLLGKPLLIHEQNAVAGLTNRILSRLAHKVFEAFPGSFGSRIPVYTVGNPVRGDIASLPPPDIRFGTRLGQIRLLVLGGSQGALSLNQVVPEALALLAKDSRPQVRHQAGDRTVAMAKHAYTENCVDAQTVSFIDDMAEAYAWADLVICRAGALTIAELTAAGVGALLVPYPSAVDDHQTKNARVMIDVGAGLILPQDQLTPEHLAGVLGRLFADRAALLQMAVAARRIGVTDASRVIADACLELLPECSVNHD